MNNIYKILDKKEARKLTFDEARQIDDFLLREIAAKAYCNDKCSKEKHNADLEKLNALTIKI